MKHEDKRPIGDRLVDRALGELDADECAELDRELEASPELQRRRRLEEGLNRALAERLARVPAPPGLETRVRAALDEAASPTPSTLPWYRRPFYGAVAAMAIIVVATLPFLLDRDDVLQLDRREAVVVDRDCDRAGLSLGEQRLCPKPEHVNALRVADGSYLALANGGDPEAADLLRTREMRGHRVTVSGRIVDDALQIELLTDHGLDASIARARARGLLRAAFEP